MRSYERKFFGPLASSPPAAPPMLLSVPHDVLRLVAMLAAVGRDGAFAPGQLHSWRAALTRFAAVSRQCCAAVRSIALRDVLRWRVAAMQDACARRAAHGGLVRELLQPHADALRQALAAQPERALRHIAVAAHDVTRRAGARDPRVRDHGAAILSTAADDAAPLVLFAAGYRYADPVALLPLSAQSEAVRVAMVAFEVATRTMRTLQLLRDDVHAAPHAAQRLLRLAVHANAETGTRAAVRYCAPLTPPRTLCIEAVTLQPRCLWLLPEAARHDAGIFGPACLRLPDAVRCVPPPAVGEAFWLTYAAKFAFCRRYAANVPRELRRQQQFVNAAVEAAPPRKRRAIRRVLPRRATDS